MEAPLDVKEVVAYLASSAPAGVLALVAADGIKSDSALVKAVGEEPVQVLCTYDVTERKLPEWVAEQFARAGAKADARRLSRAHRHRR